MQVAAEYFKNTTLLLMGVICVAASVEKWNLHKRIALRMVMMAGAKPGMWVNLYLWGSLRLKAAAWNHSDPIHGQNLPWFKSTSVWGIFHTHLSFQSLTAYKSSLLFLPPPTPRVSPRCTPGCSFALCAAPRCSPCGSPTPPAQPWWCPSWRQCSRSWWMLRRSARSSRLQAAPLLKKTSQ